MRIKEPQPFDATKEYKPGERAIYNNMVIIAEKWDKWDKKFSNENPQTFPPRCMRCQIKRVDCPSISLQCDKFSRQDKKTIYWKFLRPMKGFKVKNNFLMLPDDRIMFLNKDVEPIDNNNED